MMNQAINSELGVSNSDVYQLDREYVFHSWSVQGALNPMVIAGGSGCKLWDYDGKEYLDFSSQLVNTNIGHQHPKVIESRRCISFSFCQSGLMRQSSVRGNN